ncbi:MAG: hypothetical protein ACRD4F_17310, partial [Candidatus Angelobacter sp.]
MIGLQQWRTALVARVFCRVGSGLPQRELPKSFFVYDVRHLRSITAVIFFEDVDQALNASPGHALF